MLKNTFVRIAIKKGRAAAITALARKLAEIFWIMAAKKVPYMPADELDYELKIKANTIRNICRKMKRLNIGTEDLVLMELQVLHYHSGYKGLDRTVAGIGSGKANTTLITTGCATVGIAARLCADLTLNGYSDWYLPSIVELNILITNKDLIGGIDGIAYWSSTQQPSGFNFTNVAYYIYASDNSKETNDKSNKLLVRPVRSF